VKKILFTKELDKHWLKENLTGKLDFEVCPVLKIEVYPTEKFTLKINPNSSRFIISSQNAVKSISDLDLKGAFFVVGEKTAQKLIENGLNVVHFEDYASELADYILKNFQAENWNFFCGNNRRETLFEKLIPNGHTLNEIICYESIPINYRIGYDAYDAVVFFSPLAVKTYFSNNSIPESSIIFSIGNTTTEEVKNYTKNKIITAEIPLLEMVIEKINSYYDTEK